MTQVTIRAGEERALLALQQLEIAARAVGRWQWEGVSKEPARDMDALRVALARLDAVRETLKAVHGESHSGGVYIPARTTPEGEGK